MNIVALTVNDLPAVWNLRQLAMYPGRSAELAKLARDEQSIHFGIWQNEQLISVITIEQNGTRFQFRKFATLPALQGQGIGTALLQYVMQWMEEHGASEICCNARTSARKFYEKFGMTTEGATYLKNDIPYIKMVKHIIYADHPRH